MNTLTNTALTLVALTTVALAQPATPATPAAPGGKSAEKAATPPSKAADKAADKAAATSDAKKPSADAKAGAAVAPAAAMEAPKPPQEVADMLKTLQGTWKCPTKLATNPSDPSQMTEVKNMTLSFKGELEKWWIGGTLKGRAGKMKMHGMMFATYDPTMKKWYRTMVDNMGGSESTWSDGVKDNKVVWTGEGRGMGMGSFKVRNTEEIVGPKEIKMTGEMSKDGRTWIKTWESACKK